MAKNEMTRKQALEVAIAALDYNDPKAEEARGVLSKMVEQLSKPKTTPTVNKTRVANEALVREIAESVPAGTTITCGWITENVQGVMTPQKAVALMKVGESLGLFRRTVDGKKVGYERL